MIPASAQHPLDGKVTGDIPPDGEVYGFELFDQVLVGTEIPVNGPGNGLRDHLPCTRKSLESWQVFDPLTSDCVPEKLKAIRNIKKRFGNTVLIEAAAAPYSCVGLTCGLTEAMMLAMIDRELLNDMCEFFIEQQYVFIKGQLEAGAHATPLPAAPTQPPWNQIPYQS